MNENTVSIEIGWQTFLSVIEGQHGTVPAGAQRWLKAAYYAGARGALVAAQAMGDMPPEQQQPALDALVRELAEAEV